MFQKNAATKRGLWVRQIPKILGNIQVNFNQPNFKMIDNTFFNPEANLDRGRHLVL